MISSGIFTVVQINYDLRNKVINDDIRYFHFSSNQLMT